ncbi:MAG: hypothetical protein HC778_08095, partial [Chamaesiphon sp. CSU_1_12]|nr:hypothetical protein [Chamaesiphon sp. CSU_1_12]
KDSENWQDWLNFFSKLGMLDALKPQNLLDLVNALIEKSMRTGSDSVADSCCNVIKYINNHWDDFKDTLVNVRDKQLNLIHILKEYAWLPVVTSPDSLQKYPAALIFTGGLYPVSKVSLWEHGYLIASQRPLLPQSIDLKPEVKKALGLEFGVDKWEQVVAHLDKLIALWDKKCIQ